MEFKSNCFILLILLNSVVAGELQGGYDAATSICNTRGQFTDVENSGIWRQNQKPVEDDYDRHMMNKTGCKYKSIVYNEIFYLPDVTFNGQIYEWRGAMRAASYTQDDRDEVNLDVVWGEEGEQSFYMGRQENTVSVVNDHTTYYKYTEISTPEILARDDYVWLYLRLEPRHLSFTTECDTRMVFHRRIDLDSAVVQGDLVGMHFELGMKDYDKVHTAYGAKFLYDCPANIAVKESPPHIVQENVPQPKPASPALTPPGNSTSQPYEGNSGEDVPTFICKITVPSSVEISNTIWKHRKTPSEDDLDKYMVHKTGCTYKALKYYDYGFETPNTEFDGFKYEWRGAVRTGAKLRVSVKWVRGSDYHSFQFVLGLDRNSNNRIYRWSETARDFGFFDSSSSKFLSRDRYVGLYVKLEPGRLTFRTDCGTEFDYSTNAVVVEKGAFVRLEFSSASKYGGKLLYNCPVVVEEKTRKHVVSPICNDTVPRTVELKDDIWKKYRIPGVDEVDEYTVNKTGCKYGAGKEGDAWFSPAEVSFDGSAYEWRGAVRAPENAGIRVKWGENTGYDIYITRGFNLTKVYQRSPWQQLLHFHNPGLLSRERYVWFYLRLEPGSLTFGTDCNTLLEFTLNVTISRRDRVRLEIGSLSDYGGKFLYRCPVDTTSTEKKQSAGAVAVNTIQHHEDDASNDTIYWKCNIAVPSSVKTNNSIWSKYNRPEKDALDTHMVDQTGCKYKAAGYSFKDLLPNDESFTSEWRVALRAEGDVSIKVETYTDYYYFWIGREQNTLTEVNKNSIKISEFSTPGLFSRERYVWFHLKLEQGRVTLRTECDQQLIFTHELAAERGQRVKVQAMAWSVYGGKILYDCPANIAVCHCDWSQNSNSGAIDNTSTEVLIDPQPQNEPTNLTMINICNLTPPSTVEVDDDIWHFMRRPAKDDLDQYMEKKTGCKYKVVERNDNWFALPRAFFKGIVYEWRGAVRAGQNALISVTWEGSGFSFFIGQHQNTITNVYQQAPPRGTSTDLPSISTLGILSRDSYVWFYAKLEADRLTFRTDCNSGLNFTHPVTAARGDWIYINIHSSSNYGGKFLISCPANIAGLS